MGRNIVALLVIDGIFDGVEIGRWGLVLLGAAVLALANAFVKPVLTILTFPIILITLGLFYFVLNVAMLALAEWIAPDFDRRFLDVCGRDDRRVARELGALRAVRAHEPRALRRGLAFSSMEARMTAADVAYVEANYVSLEEACAGRPEALEQVRAVAAAGQLPKPSYVLPDGTEMVPADYFDIAMQAASRSSGSFAAGGSPRRGRHRVGGASVRGIRCLSEGADAGEHRAEGGSRQGGQRTARLAGAGRQRLALRPGPRSTSSTSWSGRSRRTTTGLAGARAFATAASRPR